MKACMQVYCVPIRIPDIIDRNLKKDDQILLVFGTNIPDTTGHQITVQVPTSPSVYFCSTSGNQNKRNISFIYDSMII